MKNVSMETMKQKINVWPVFRRKVDRKLAAETKDCSYLANSCSFHVLCFLKPIQPWNEQYQPGWPQTQDSPGSTPPLQVLGLNLCPTMFSPSHVLKEILFMF